ncbi:siderophore-interacting protein [Actinoplanes sp. NBC_00393]|uniref:siderophore-interacting protein n=1 Tax=Actinoplanes sp. NBC_00393 TaxID=2975953 RepID=UPI002E1CE04E
MPDRRDLVARLADACLHGDVAALEAVLTTDAVAVCDGIGLLPVRGAADVARLLTRLTGGGADLTSESVNGTPGLALRRAGRVVAVAAVQPAGDRIATVWIVLNPAKLSGWN